MVVCRERERERGCWTVCMKVVCALVSVPELTLCTKIKAQRIILQYSGRSTLRLSLGSART